MRRILRLAGQSPDTDNPWFESLSLSRFTPEERIDIIDAAMESLPDIGLVIIDGVRDLLHDINSTTETTTVISLLMKWTDIYQFHLHTVLHQNKSDENARGHLGIELANKAETVMLVEKDKDPHRHQRCPSCLYKGGGVRAIRLSHRRRQYRLAGDCRRQQLQ